VIARETKNIKEIKSILCHPEIYERISDDDSMAADEFEPPLDVEYIAGYVNSDIIGIAIYNDIKEGVKFHFQVLPEYRGKYSKTFARMALDVGRAKNASIYAEIPSCYPEVIKFAEYLSFKIVGNIEKHRKKFGKFHDVIILRLENGIR